MGIENVWYVCGIVSTVEGLAAMCVVSMLLFFLKT